VIGVDEVGRGCLVGPVVTAAVAVPLDIELRSNSWLGDITDSKKISETKRGGLSNLIRANMPFVAIGEATPSEIDELNIFHATYLAMYRAVENLLQLDLRLSRASAVLIDGNHAPKNDWFGLKKIPVVKGDLKSFSIACASIVAKEERDTRMRVLGVEHPQYGFEKHKGYPTKAHVESIAEHGILESHRRSFGPVAKIIEAIGHI